MRMRDRYPPPEARAIELTPARRMYLEAIRRGDWEAVLATGSTAVKAWATDHGLVKVDARASPSAPLQLTSAGEAALLAV